MSQPLPKYRSKYAVVCSSSFTFYMYTKVYKKQRRSLTNLFSYSVLARYGLILTYSLCICIVYSTCLFSSFFSVYCFCFLSLSLSFIYANLYTYMFYILTRTHKRKKLPPSRLEFLFAVIFYHRLSTFRYISFLSLFLVSTCYMLMHTHCTLSYTNLLTFYFTGSTNRPNLGLK